MGESDLAGGATVSVVIPVYNGRGFVADAIESAYGQTHAPGEVIVVDDGSTDDSSTVVTQFEGRPGFSSFRKRNGGEATARNFGAERATGEYVAFLDQDDLWRPEKLERQLAHFDPAWAMSFTAYEQVTPTTSELEVHDAWDPDPRAVLKLQERSPAVRISSTMLIRRDALRRIGGFERVVPFGADWLLGLRFAAAGNRIGYLPEPLTQHRWHGKNLSNGQGRFFECAVAVADLYGDRRLRAWHRLNAAVYSREEHDRRAARRLILQAACIRPRAIRPGWIRLL